MIRDKEHFRAQLTYLLRTNAFAREVMMPLFQATIWLALGLGLIVGFCLGYLTHG